MNAHVAIYPVEAGGLSKDNHLAAQHTMNDMAAWTGGRVFLNRNDLAIGMKNSLEDGSVYYTLEYYPDNKQWDGQFRAIKVSVERPGIKLRYREGYYAVDPAKIAKDEADSVAEDFQPLPSGRFAFRNGNPVSGPDHSAGFQNQQGNGHIPR